MVKRYLDVSDEHEDNCPVKFENGILYTGERGVTNTRIFGVFYREYLWYQTPAFAITLPIFGYYLLRGASNYGGSRSFPDPTIIWPIGICYSCDREYSWTPVNREYPSSFKN